MVLLLVPLTCTGAFLLVSEQKLEMYQYNHDGSIERCYSEYLRYDQYVRPPHHSIFTSWCRPSPRSPADSDLVYLMCDDGTLHQVHVRRLHGKTSMQSFTQVRKLDVTVDHVMFVSMTSQNSDRLVVVGSLHIIVYEVSIAATYNGGKLTFGSWHTIFIL